MNAAARVNWRGAVLVTFWVAWFALLIGLAASLSGCANTAQAVQELPVGWADATWNLVVAMVWDTLDLLSIFL